MATSGETVRPSGTTRAADPPAPERLTTAAPPILLLHGQPGGAADWDGVLARLRRRRRVAPIAVDRPGWDGISPASDLAGNARAALAILDARGVERAVVVGHSLGGAIAAWLAAAHPERVSALVLAAPAANRAALYRIDRWLAAPVAGDLAAATTLGGIGLALSLGPLRRRIARSSGLDDAYLRAARTEVVRPARWRAYASEQRTLVRDLPDLERHLAQIAAPTMIVAGAQDRVVPLRAVRRLAEQIPGARLQVSPHGGHLLPQRDPGLVAAAIAAALPD